MAIDDDDGTLVVTTTAPATSVVSPLFGKGNGDQQESTALREVTYASMQMSNEYWRAHVVVDHESSFDEHGRIRGLVGLYNQGNTCYLNSAVQCLVNCPPLREYFRSYLPPLAVRAKDSVTHSLLCPKKPISDAFQDVVYKLWGLQTSSALRPIVFIYKVKERCAQFKGYAQQDAQEFIRCLLDVLHQELRRPIVHLAEDLIDGEGDGANDDRKSECSSSDSSASSTDELNRASGDHFETADSGLSSDAGDSTKQEEPRRAIRSPPTRVRPPSSPEPSASPSSSSTHNNRQQQFRSIISDVFDGELVSTVKCMTCHHLSNTRETFQDISLPIPSTDQIAYLKNTPPIDLCAQHRNNGSMFDSASSTASSSSSAEAGATGTAGSSSTAPLVPVTPTSGFGPSSLLQSNEYSYAYWILALARTWFIDPWLSYIIYFYRFIFSTNISLEDCLQAFFSADHLYGEDMYSCDKCTMLRNGVKQCRLTKLPEILCIHLKRFRHEYAYNTKVGTKVTFPLCDLDMRPYVLQSVLEDHKDQDDFTTQYDLIAFVSHRGSGVEYGHYVAYCRNSLDGNWYEYDDCNVTAVSELEVMSREAYVLFYQKKGTDSTEAFRDQVMQVLSEINEPSGDAYFISSEWLHRFRTFSSPGPITNTDFLCEHLGKLPVLRDNEVLPIPANVWAMLFERFGGGPPCDRLGVCEICTERTLHIVTRKRDESEAIKRLEKQNPYSERLPYNLISYSWWEQWEAFVTQLNRAPPGPIRNEALLQKHRDGSFRLRQGINFKSLTRPQWLYLHKIYGGGPEVFRIYERQPSPEEVDRIVRQVDQMIAAVKDHLVKQQAKRDAATGESEPIVELPADTEQTTTTSIDSEAEGDISGDSTKTLKADDDGKPQETSAIDDEDFLNSVIKKEFDLDDNEQVTQFLG